MDKPTELPNELTNDITDTESVDDEKKIEKPKKQRPPATPAQIEARKKNFEKMLKKRQDESLALAKKKVEDKLKKKQERKTGNSSFPCDPIQDEENPPQQTPKINNRKYGVVGERRVPYDDDEYDIIEEHITKKPKKKRIVYKEESDSEEEVIIRKKKPVKEEPVEPVKEEPKKISQLIRFF